MIYRKDWFGEAKIGRGYKESVLYRGWFLFYVIPLVIVRVNK